jgi:ABC-type phosphate transport system substrate-binding protein
MTGVALGVLDIGDASSFGAVTTGISQFPSANLLATEVGASAVVFIANWGATPPACADGITLAALQALYTAPGGQVGAVTCGTADGNATIVGFAAGTTYTAVSRSDLPSGTEDTACSYLNNGATVCSSTSNNAVALPGVTAVGNPGVLAYVQAHASTIGFVDIGFAEGAATTPGSTTAAGVTILEPNTANVATTKVSACTASGSFECFAAPSGTTASLDSFIKASLGTSGGTTTTPVYPDVTAGTGLTRTFWMVTAGPATADAQEFITFMQSPANQGFWTNAGYYSIYQIKPITPP